MAHTERVPFVLELQEQVDPDFISWDDGSRGEWANGESLWRMLAEEPTVWSVVLQDDALPIPNFRHHLTEALIHAPATAIGLYVGTCRPRGIQVIDAIEEAEKEGSAWLEADTLLWGVGVALPTAQIPELIEWCSRAELPYDARIGAWFKRRGLPVRYTWPSLVDHRDAPSVIPNRPRPCERVAHRVGVPDRFDGPVIRIGDYFS